MLVFLVAVPFLYVISTKMSRLLMVSLVSHKVLLTPVFYNHLSTMQNTLSRHFACFFIFAIPQISFIQYYVPTGNIAVFGCMIEPKLEKCQTSTSYMFFLYSSDFLPREKTLVLTLVFGFFS